MKQVLAITQALSEESRLRIVKSLDGSTLCLCHFTEILGLAPSTISKHLHALVEAGLITSWQEGKWRFYRWADAEGSACTKRALEWLRESLSDDPLAIDDAARRAVALQKCPAPVPHREKKRVLFLCTGNSCRSQMAEGLLRERANDRFEVFSAGLDPREIPDLTYKVMDEIGVNIRAQRAKNVMEFLGREHFHYLITVCANAEERCPVFPGVSQRLYWPVQDPARTDDTGGTRMSVFRGVRDELDRRIVSWLGTQGPM
jgi:arsenate reductase